MLAYIDTIGPLADGPEQFVHDVEGRPVFASSTRNVLPLVTLLLCVVAIALSPAQRLVKDRSVVHDAVSTRTLLRVGRWTKEEQEEAWTSDRSRS